MHGVLLLALLAWGPAAPGDPKAKEEPPATKELFANEDWYKGEKGKEEAFVGVLEKAAERAKGFGRHNPYRLVMTRDGKESVREVYVGAKPELLEPYTGRKVKLIGKAVDM